MSKTGEYTEDIDVDLEEPEEEYEGGGAGGAGGKKPKKPRKVKTVDVLNWIRTRTGKQRTTAQFIRVVKGLDKHPRASLYELQHGVGSKAAKAYRARQMPSTGGGGEVDYVAISEAMRDSGLTAVVDGKYVGVEGLILARDTKKVYAYGGVIKYDARKDKGRSYTGLPGRVVAEIKARLKTKARK